MLVFKQNGHHIATVTQLLTSDDPAINFEPMLLNHEVDLELHTLRETVAAFELNPSTANILGTDLGGVEREVFANSEIYIHFTESVRGSDCFVVQSHVSPVNFHVVEQLIMIDALKRASAKRITAVIPYFGYARQDKKGRPREPITAKLMGDLFVTAGADRLASVDLHTGQIQRPLDERGRRALFARKRREDAAQLRSVVAE